MKIPIFASAKTLFIAGIICASTAAAASQCLDAYKTMPELTRSHLYRLPTPFEAPTKGQYETQAEYGKRVAFARAQHEAEGAKKMAQLPRQLVFISSLYPMYNAETQTLSESLLVGSRTLEIDGKKMRMSTRLKRDGEATTRPLGLGAKSESRRYIGVVFRTKLRHPSLRPDGPDLKLRIGRDVARSADGNVALALAGELVAPWSFSDYQTSTDWGAVKETATFGTYAVMEVKCAALIDARTKTVIYEFQ